MNLGKAVLCGLVQGLTEFLPVSSSGHLALAHAFLGASDLSSSVFTFDILLHLATLVAVVTVYFSDIVSLVPAFFSLVRKVFGRRFRLSECVGEERLCLLLLVASVPLGVAALIGDRVETLSSNPRLVGGILAVNGLFLLLGERAAHGAKRAEELTVPRGAFIGLCQLLAILPGLSRSGSTVSGGRLVGLTREEAVRFSFLLSVPAILGASGLGIVDLFKNPVPKSDIPAYALGMLTALVCGFAAIGLLRRMAKSSSFRFFAYYCLAVGTAAVIFG